MLDVLPEDCTNQYIKGTDSKVYHVAQHQSLPAFHDFVAFDNDRSSQHLYLSTLSLITVGLRTILIQDHFCPFLRLNELFGMLVCETLRFQLLECRKSMSGLFAVSIPIAISLSPTAILVAGSDCGMP